MRIHTHDFQFHVWPFWRLKDSLEGHFQCGNTLCKKPAEGHPPLLRFSTDWELVFFHAFRKRGCPWSESASIWPAWDQELDVVFSPSKLANRKCHVEHESVKYYKIITIRELKIWQALLSCIHFLSLEEAKDQCCRDRSSTKFTGHSGIRVVGTGQRETWILACAHVCVRGCAKGKKLRLLWDSVRKTKGRRPRRAVLVHLDEDKEQQTQDSRRCLVTISTVLILLSVCSVSLFRRMMLLGNAAVLFQFLCSERVGGSLSNSKAPLQTGQLREKGKQVIWAKPKVEGGRAGGWETSSDP